VSAQFLIVLNSEKTQSHAFLILNPDLTIPAVDDIYAYLDSYKKRKSKAVLFDPLLKKSCLIAEWRSVLENYLKTQNLSQFHWDIIVREEDLPKIEKSLNAAKTIEQRAREILQSGSVTLSLQHQLLEQSAQPVLQKSKMKKGLAHLRECFPNNKWSPDVNFTYIQGTGETINETGEQLKAQGINCQVNGEEKWVRIDCKEIEKFIGQRTKAIQQAVALDAELIPFITDYL
jgi:hypothetical protein